MPRPRAKQNAPARSPAGQTSGTPPAQVAEEMKTLDRHTIVVFVSSTILLILFHYFAKPESYRDSAFDLALRPFFTSWLGAHANIAPYVHWAAMSLALRVAIPLAIVAWVFREPLSAYGWQWSGQLKHAPKYAGLYLAMLPLLFWAATQTSFQQRYPFYRSATEGGAVFWGYELLYGVQFMGVETFFRGFMTFALYRRFGYNALFIMTIPYVMVHFNKPLPETFGALGAGLLLGYMALKAGSCVLGIFLHWAVGFTMDVLGIAKAVGGILPALRAIF
jgi:membrane protease YdiL (CAAX protease family)